MRWVCIHQPCYLPWLGLFHKIAASDTYVVLDDCQLSHRSWITRVNVVGNGRPLLLSVPVHHSFSQGTTVAEARIDTRHAWQRKHRLTLEQNYRKAPHFAEVEPLLDIALGQPWERLIDLNLAVMTWVMERLGIATPLRRASDLAVGEVAATERLVALVRAAGGEGYLSGNGSGGYLDPAAFARAGLGLAFQDFRQVPYAQKGAAEFLPGMSIVDVIANVGLAGARERLEGAGVQAEAGA